MEKVKQLIRVLALINTKLAVVFRGVSWTFLALMTAIVVAQVFFRYVLNSSLTWAEDVSLMMMIWVAFCIAPIAYRFGANVALDTFTQFLHGRLTTLLNLAIHVLIIVMLVVLISESLDMIGRSKIRANTVPLPMRYVYFIMPIAFGSMVLVGLELILRGLTSLSQPAAPEAQMPEPSADMVSGE